MMADTVYILCAITSGACAWLLTRGYLRSRERLLLWSGACFVFLAISNILLVIDLAILSKEVDLSTIRSIPALAGVSLLLFGLIWESR